MLEGSILQKLNELHCQKNKPLNLGVYYKNTLVALCHALEDFILESQSNPLMVTAFQRGKWYLQEAERYGEIASKARAVAILATSDSGFDEHPTSRLSNVHLLSLNPLDAVAQEWHLIVYSPTYTAMVLCQELSEADYGIGNRPQTDLERKFYGFWTFERELIQETMELAITHVGKYNQQLQAQLTEQLQEMVSQFYGHQRDDLSKVVSKVVDYLQTSQQKLQQDASFTQTLDDNLISNEMQAFLRLAEIIDVSDLRNPKAAAEVAALAETIGQLLDLPAWQIKRLRLASLVHRLASLPAIATDSEELTPSQQQALARATDLPRASLLRIMPQMQAIAKILTYQTEAWDGSGMPENLAYDRIPLESRIIRLIADFQKKVNEYQHQSSEQNPLTRALADCQAQANKIYDPKLVEALTLLIMGMQQGMTINTYLPKIATGIWLLETDV